MKMKKIDSIFDRLEYSIKEINFEYEKQLLDLLKVEKRNIKNRARYENAVKYLKRQKEPVDYELFMKAYKLDKDYKNFNFKIEEIEGKKMVSYINVVVNFVGEFL